MALVRFLRGKFPAPSRRGPVPPTRLGVENLEVRDNPSSVLQMNGKVYIYAEASGADVVVSRSSPVNNLTITDKHTGQVTTIPQGYLDHTEVVFTGNVGNDHFFANGTINPVLA